MVVVLDLFDGGVLVQRGGIKAHAAHHLERGVELGQRLDRGAGTHGLVTVQHHHAIDVRDRNNGARKAPFGLGLRGAAVRLGGKGIQILAAKAFQRGDQIRADALRNEGRAAVDARVHDPGAAVAAHGPAAHGLHAARNDHVFHARHDLGRGQVDGLQARGAKARLRHARHGLRPARVQHGGAGNVGALLAHGRHAAQHHIIDQRGIEPVARLQRLQQRAQQPHGGGLVQAAVLLALAARRAHGVVDIGFGHGSSLVNGWMKRIGVTGSARPAPS